MKLKIAFAGFRHGHIFSLYNMVMKRADFKIVGICEEDVEKSLLFMRQEIKVTDTNFDEMLSRIDCDIVAIGDYYAKRGSLAIRALQAGKHIIVDKPLCTSLDEYKIIAELAEKKNLKVGCMFELRSAAEIIEARDMILSGELGKIVQIQFSAQHPISLKTRPQWYFEAGKHGGTINDIASHAIDIIPWMTGLEYKKIVAARNWHALGMGSEYFRDAAQFMLEMDNGCGVMGDVSYAATDAQKDQLPTYWRFTIWGTKGMLEFRVGDDRLYCYKNDKESVNMIGFTRNAQATTAGIDYLDSFVCDINNVKVDLDTQTVLESTKRTLELQRFADVAFSE